MTSLEGKWLEILETNDHPRRKEVAKALGDFSKSLTERYAGEKGQDQLLRDRQRWTLFFRDNYRQIVALAKTAG